MKKYYLLLLAGLIALYSGAQAPKKSAVQTVPNPRGNVDYAAKQLNQNKAITCVDTSFYPDYKASGYQITYYNTFGNTEGGAQAYDYSGSGEVLGFVYYTIHDLEGTPGDKPAIPVNFKVYNVDGAYAPTTAIRTQLGSVADVGFDYQYFSFTTPVPVTGNFAVAMEIAATAAVTDTFYNVINADGDGLGEGLASYWAPAFGGYYASAALGYDIDMLIFPIIRHNLEANFTLPDLCIGTGQFVTFTNTSSWIPETNSMFNLLGIIGGSNYTWSFGDGTTATTEDASYVYTTAGAYSVRLTDSLFTWTGVCVESKKIRVSVGLNTSVASFTNPLCNGSSNGTITMSSTGGIAPYEYTKNGTTFSTTNPLTAFNVGTKTIIVRDSVGCRDTITQALTQPSAFTFTKASTPASCGSADGTITFSAMGGTGTIQYSINGTTYQATGNFINLPATTYTLYARDANNCVGTTTITVANTGAPVLDSAYVTSVTCNGGNDGQLLLSATGGTGGLTYSIDGVNFGTDSVFNGLSSGTYTVTVRDGVGCDDSRSAFVDQPDSIIADAGADQTVCANVNGGQVTLNGSVMVATGYSWTATGGGTFSAANAATTTFTPTSTQITNGSAEVVLTTTGNGACPADADTVMITINPAPTADAGADMSACANNVSINLAGSVTNATGGTWSTTAGATFGNANSLTSSFNSSTPNTYNVVLTTTGNGLCTAVKDTVVITITPAPTADAGPIGAACSGDTVTLSGTVTVATGGTWTTTGTGTLDSVSQIAATYVVTAQDASNGSLTFTFTTTGNGACLAASDGVFYFADPSPVFSLGNDTTLCAGEALTLTVGLGADYSYAWSNSVVTESNTVTTSDIYSVTVTDTNNCDASDAIVVTFESCDSLGVADMAMTWVKVYPNPTTGMVNLTMSVEQSTTLEVLNILGEVITTRTLGVATSNVMVDLSSHQNGVYFFRFTQGNQVVTKQINLVR